MPFNSLAYALLLALSGAWVRIGPRPAAMLIVASLAFYAAAGPYDTTIFLAAVTLNWLVQVAVPAGRPRIAAAVIVNIGLIGYFKYRDFLLGEVSQAGSYLDTTLPLGISFYSFQALAYHIDVAQGRSEPAKSFREFFLFKAFFPQLVAGPIVRPQQTLPQFRRLFGGHRARHRPLAFQIYFDFSGYSDIAIGSAYLLGIRLPRNFATPFLASSIPQFWQRWHITFTLFLRDYVFLPLADIRLVARRYRVVQHLGAIILTMALCGLWHGAGWNFIVWGTLHGLAIVFATVWARYLGSPAAAVGWAATFGFFVITLVFFRSPNLPFAFDYLGTMLSFRGGLPPTVDDVAPPWQAAVGIVALFALHWAEFYVQRTDVLYALRRRDGPLLRGLL